MFSKLKEMASTLLLDTKYRCKSSHELMLATNLLKEIIKLEHRYNRYETTLKEIAKYYNYDCWTIALGKDLSKEAKDALKTEEELNKEQVDKLLKCFKEVNADKDIVKTATKIYFAE